MYLLNNIKLGQTTLINDANYDISWFAGASPEQLTELGVSYVPDPATPDPTLYTWTENTDGSLNIVAIPTDQLAATAATLLSNAQAQQLLLMDSSYAIAVNLNIDYMGTIFQADATSQALIVAVLTASAGQLPPGFVWWDWRNVAQPMTFPQLQGLAGTILMRGQPLFAHCQTQKALIRAAVDIQTVQSIVW